MTAPLRDHRPGADAAIPPALRCLVCGRSAPGRWEFSCVACGGQVIVEPHASPIADSGLSAGNTPLLLSRRGPPEVLWLKDEGRNPSGSYKDRGIGAAVKAASDFGAKGVVVYSCGNAGAAAAAAAARLGLRCLVLTLPGVAGPAALQMRAHGAHLVPLEIDHATLWTSGDVGVLQDALWHHGGWFPLNRISLPLRANPYYVAGCASLAKELIGQLGGPPATVVVPVGGGDLLLGLWQGFAARAECPLPRLVAAQALGADPLAQAWRAGAARIVSLTAAHTIAGGIEMVTGNDEALSAVRRSGGAAYSIADEEILATMVTLARVEGIYTGPEGATAAAAALRLVAERADRGSVVAVLTGGGLKYPELWKSTDQAVPCAVRFEAILGRVGAA